MWSITIPPLVGVHRERRRTTLKQPVRPVEDAYKKEYTINDNGTEKNIVVEIIDTAGQEEFSAGLHDKVTSRRAVNSFLVSPPLIHLWECSLFDKERDLFWCIPLQQLAV